MPCEHVSIPGGGTAIICTSRRRPRCSCGRVATLLCDWRTPTKRGTCDAPVCPRCTTSPARGKDLCPQHAIAFEEWKAQRAAPVTSSGDAPECAPLPDLDAPAAVTADVSVPVGRPIETSRFNARAARGRKPETAS